MHLDQEQMAIVHAILKQNLPEHEIWAFGSRVHGRNLKKFSDLDLVVMNTAPLGFMRLSDLKDAFSKSNLPIRVDVVDWDTTDKSFRKIIEAEHEVIQTGERT